MKYQGSIDVPTVLWDCAKWMGEARRILNEKVRDERSNRGYRTNKRNDFIGCMGEILLYHWCEIHRLEFIKHPMVEENPRVSHDTEVNGRKVDCKAQEIGRIWSVSVRSHHVKPVDDYWLWAMDEPRNQAFLWISEKNDIGSWPKVEMKNGNEVYRMEVPEKIDASSVENIRELQLEVLSVRVNQ